jgi:cell division control protein 11
MRKFHYVNVTNITVRVIRLKQLDIEFMRRMGKRVNIIPVIAKADSLTPTELVNFKKRILEDISYHKIPIFEFPYDPENDDEETINENKELKACTSLSTSLSFFIQLN